METSSADSVGQIEREIIVAMSELVEAVERKQKLLRQRDSLRRRHSLEQTVFQVGDVLRADSNRRYLLTRIEPDMQGGPPSYFGLSLGADNGVVAGEFRLNTISYRKLGHVRKVEWT